MTITKRRVAVAGLATTALVLACFPLLALQRRLRDVRQLSAYGCVLIYDRDEDNTLRDIVADVVGDHFVYSVRSVRLETPPEFAPAGELSLRSLANEIESFEYNCGTVAHLPSFDGLSKCKHLTDLRITNAMIREDYFSDGGPFPRLEYLQLSGSHIDDLSFLTASRFPLLEALDLAGTEVGDADLKSLSLQKLTHLMLEGTRVTAGGLSGLMGCPSLETVFISESQSSSGHRAPNTPFTVIAMPD